jgi:hypothetical protein
MFNAGEGGFRDRDLYVFCANASDGKIVAQGNPNAKQQLGQDQRTLKDSTGKNFGMELFAAGKKPEGHITKVSYMFARPGSDTTPMAKESFVTKVSDLMRRWLLQVDRSTADRIPGRLSGPRDVRQPHRWTFSLSD